MSKILVQAHVALEVKDNQWVVEWHYLLFEAIMICYVLWVGIIV